MVGWPYGKPGGLSFSKDPPMPMEYCDSSEEIQRLLVKKKKQLLWMQL